MADSVVPLYTPSTLAALAAMAFINSRLPAPEVLRKRSEAHGMAAVIYDSDMRLANTALIDIIYDVFHTNPISMCAAGHLVARDSNAIVMLASDTETPFSDVYPNDFTRYRLDRHDYPRLVCAEHARGCFKREHMYRRPQNVVGL